MLPILSISYTLNRPFVYRISSRDFADPQSLIEKKSNLPNLYFRKFRLPMSFTTEVWPESSYPVMLAILVGHILTVSFWGRYKEMIRTNAYGVVALMTDKFIVRYRAMMNSVGDTVSSQKKTSSVRKDSISSGISDPSPDPTSISIDYHSFPKFCSKFLSISDYMWFPHGDIVNENRQTFEGTRCQR